MEGQSCWSTKQYIECGPQRLIYYTFWYLVKNCFDPQLIEQDNHLEQVHLQSFLTKEFRLECLESFERSPSSPIVLLIIQSKMCYIKTN